ncbi:MAG: hypothetical protein JNK40_14145 [Chromatiales bacterium]|nr:hypothetical protein [Chromatiales bacterium]
MSKGILCVVAVIGAGLMAVTPTALADTDVLLARVGQFQLDNGESKTMRARAAIKAYRVCMEEGRGAASLKVTYDGKEALVAPGECQLIEAATIKVASATRLDDGMTLIGSIGSRTGKSYQTDVSLAQTARND